MRKKMYSEQFLRKRKMMLRLPVVFVPMLCVAFYGLGGGKGDGPRPGEVKGLNMTLPVARFDSRAQPKDKLGFYEKAKQDSMRLSERRKQDPYAAVDSGAGPRVLNPDQQAEAAMAKLDELRQVLGKKVSVDSLMRRRVDTSMMTGVREPSEVGAATVAALLERLKGAPVSSGDSEMEKLDGMLDKLIRIQHPELVKGDTGKVVGDAAFVVSPLWPESAMSSMSADGADVEGGRAFMEIGEFDVGDTVRDVAIGAVIDGEQVLTAGATVALRIVSPCLLDGREIPANQPVYGVASLSGERLLVHVSSLRVGQSIVPVSMRVYDLDGLEGIRVPGAITRDVAKESADQALNGLEVGTADPSLGAQAASAGLAFARTLTSRKIRLVRVSLPAGYRVLLKNSKSTIH